MASFLVLLMMILVSALRWQVALGGTVKCSHNAENCTVESYLKLWGDRSICAFTKVEYPKTEKQLVKTVAEAARHGTKVKVASVSIHSSPKLVCPGDTAGALISTRDFDASIAIDASAKTVTLGAGVRLYQLLEKLGEAGLALPNVPVWGGLTVVGALSTGAHGSSHWPGTVPLHDHVLAVRLVVPAGHEHGYARVVVANCSRNADVLNAARLSLGVLGVISVVTLKVEPDFKRNVIRERASDRDLAERVLELSAESEFGEINWYPSQRQAVILHSNRVPFLTPGEDVYPEPSLDPVLPADVEAGRAVQDAAEASGDRAPLCTQAAATLDLLPSGYGPTLVGFSRSLQSSTSCLIHRVDPNTICFWEDDAVLMHETSLAVPFSRIADFIKDVQALRDKRPHSLCGLGFYFGIWMRFLNGNSQALLGEKERSVDVNSLYLRARDAQQPRLDEDILEEIEQMALLKYGAKAHWGKSNRFISFLNSSTRFGEPLQRFVGVKNRLDPHGLFSNPWTDAVLGIDDSYLHQTKPFCALEGLCICQEDSHCAPLKGYFCRPGLVYTEARVCRYDEKAFKDEI